MTKERLKYDSENAFAKIIAGELPAYKVYEDDHTLAIMDIMPQARGHVLVIPKYQAVELTDLPLDYATAVMRTAKKVIQAQRKMLNSMGVVQMQLNGKDAGQTVFHYHMHLIPSSIHELGGHASQETDQEELVVLAQDLKDAIEAAAQYDDTP